MPETTLDAHLARCGGCTAWLRDVTAATRRLAVREALPHVDLAPGVVAAAAQDRQQRVPRRTALRLALAGTALLQLLVAVPAVLHDSHAGREVAVSEVALALGVMAAAARPWRAAGMLPVVAALSLGLLLISGLDLAEGHVSVWQEAPHLLALVETLLLLRLRHGRPGEPPAGDATGRPALRRVA